MGDEMKETLQPIFFTTPAAFRTWLEQHYATTQEVWVGFYKKASGEQSITWPESVDQALCFGWIDGIRKRIDDQRYMIRFTPRRRGSNWSLVNIKRAQELTEQGLMQPTGLAAFQARQENRLGQYSYEQRPDTLPEPYEQLLRQNPTAWAFFQAQSPSYRKAAIWWVVSAKTEATRLKRLNQLSEASAEGRKIPPFAGPSKPA
jgi:uncharacterized protein YdeI (YjbR/CyaY-like superfamily)